MNTKRGNKTISIEYCTQVSYHFQLEVDKDLQGINGLKMEYITTEINKTPLKHYSGDVLADLTKFLLRLDSTLFPDIDRKWVCHNLPGYESLTFAVLEPSFVLL